MNNNWLKKIASSQVTRNILLAATLPTLILFITLLSYFIPSRLEDAEIHQQEKGRLLANNISVSSEYAILSGNNDLLKNILKNLADEDTLSITVSNKFGEIIAEYHSPDFKQKTQGVVFQTEILQQSISLPEPFFEEEVGKTETTTEAIGNIQLTLSAEPLQQAQNNIITGALVIGLTLLTVCILVATIVGLHLTVGILNIADIVTRIAKGDLSARSENTSKGELGMLENGINQMASSLEDNTEKLKNNMYQLDQALKKAERADQAKSDFLANISHELRTPMNGTIGVMELLKTTPLNSEQQQLIEIANDSNQHFLAVVNDILDFSLLDNHKFRIEKRLFSLPETLNNCCSTLFVTAQEKGIELNLDISEQLRSYYIFSDPDRISQIILNLVTNAIKFTPSGNVLVSADYKTEQTSDDATLILKVKDTGIGIAPEKLDSVFSPFTQSDSSLGKRFGGAGLGLAICDELCKLLDGRISVCSQLGVGTTFTVELKTQLTAIEQQDSISDTIKQTKTALADKNVMIVEDNEVNLLVTGKMLKQFGINVISATSGREALNKFPDYSIDLILMDCQMPDMDGIETAGKIRELEINNKRTATPIIAVSANELEEIKQRDHTGKLNAYLSKPLRIEQLAEVLKHWV